MKTNSLPAFCPELGLGWRRITSHPLAGEPQRGSVISLPVASQEPPWFGLRIGPAATVGFPGFSEPNSEFWSSNPGMGPESRGFGEIPGFSAILGFSRGGAPSSADWNPGSGGMDPGGGDWNPGGGGSDPGSGDWNPGAGGWNPGSGYSMVGSGGWLVGSAVWTVWRFSGAFRCLDRRLARVE